MNTLTKIPFTVSGEWIARPREGRPSVLWIWEEAIEADRPIIALALLSSSGSDVSWGRARRANTCRLPVGLRIETWVETGTQVSWTIGSGGRRAWFALGQRPDMLAFASRGSTGSLSWLLDLGGQPRIRLGTIVVAEAETRGGRNGIWHLAKDLGMGGKSWTQALRRSGTGKVLGNAQDE